MAATEAGRDVAIYTYGNLALRDDIMDSYEFLTAKGATVSQVYGILEMYHRERERKKVEYDKMSFKEQQDHGSKDFLKPSKTILEFLKARVASRGN